MSRRQLSDNSTNVTLFPFLAVLLCTMGSLLLVLVVMAKVSRDKAARRAEAEKQHAVQPDPQSEEASRRFDQINHQLHQLDSARTNAEDVLRRDQLRLRHIEDHMRRLQDQLVSLQLAAAELESLEDEHFDDRVLAEREVERLQQLIAETREQIETLREEQANTKRSYAIVPYTGHHGTRRRPLYIECRRDEVILQPEGVRLTPRDFAPPIGAGNPLASALRAAREFLVNRSPETGVNEDTEPYPLILVRPDGIGAYYRVRAAIESWDADFGYEFIARDWNVEFPSANPQLAAVEYRAVELARARQKMLAAAAPRAYGPSGRAGAADSFEMDVPAAASDMSGDFLDEPDSVELDQNAETRATQIASGGDTPQQYQHPTAGAEESIAITPPADDSSRETSDPLVDQPARGKSPAADPSLGTAPGLAGTSGTSPAVPAADGVATPHQLEQGIGPKSSFESLGSIPQRRRWNSGERRPNANSPGAITADSAASLADANPTTNPSPNFGATSTSGADRNGAAASMGLAPERNSQGAVGASNWKVGGEGSADIPIRRTVQVIVRGDRLSILPDRSGSTISSLVLTGGKEVPLEGRTEFAIDEFIAGLQDHMRNWGIAGGGLYWRPVLLLNVASDGQQRAADLERLLGGSGIEVRNVATANRTDRNNAGTTR